MKRKTSKEVLAESFREVAERKAADKITVKDIVENCGYSPATFYRQFRDKYDLIAWDYARELEAKREGPVYKDPVEWVKYDLEVSKNGLAWLADLVEASRGDYTTFDILKKYYQDEEEDMYWGQAQLELIECIGKQNWLLQQL